MKNILKITLGLAFMAGVSLQAVTPDRGWTTFSTSSSQNTKWAGTNWVVIPPNTANGGEPLVTFIQGKGTNDAATIIAYVATNSTTELAGITNSTTSLSLASTNGFNAGQWLLIQHSHALLDGSVLQRYSCEPAFVSSVNANGTNVVLREAPVGSVLPGDKIYQLSPASTFAIGSNTLATVTTYNGPGLFSGQRDTPLLLLEGGATNTVINAVCAQALYP